MAGTAISFLNWKKISAKQKSKYPRVLINCGKRSMYLIFESEIEGLCWKVSQHIGEVSSPQ